MSSLWNFLAADREWNKLASPPRDDFLNRELPPSLSKHILLRECRQEYVGPIQGNIEGVVDGWIQGSLLQNGPGRFDFGDQRANHWFDGAALLHRFNINKGIITYESKFLNSEMFEKSSKLKRFAFNEFGTSTLPDPCETIFERMFSQFKPSLTDNCLVSLFPIGGNLFALADGPKMHRLDTSELQSTETVNLNERLNLQTQAGHPHTTQDGTVYNVGLTKHEKGSMLYVVYEIPNEQKGGLEKAKILHSIPSSADWHPGYMHSFGVTENYFILVEQPLTLSIQGLVSSMVFRRPFCEALRWKRLPVNFHVINRKTGKLKTLQTNTFYFFHTINQFEKGGKIIMDICCYQKADVLNELFLEAIHRELPGKLEEAFSGTPTRFIIPLEGAENEEIAVHPLTCAKMELPRFNYSYLGKPYRYFYGVTVQENCTGKIVKVDADSRVYYEWKKEGCYPNEPTFLARPNATEEDDGVLLFTTYWRDQPSRVDLRVIDAKTMKEKACVKFSCPSEVPSAIHSWFQ